MKAVILNISAWMLLPLMDGIAKFLSQEIHFLQVVWGRYFFMAVFSILITSLFFKKNLIFPKLIKIKIIRSSFLFLNLASIAAVGAGICYAFYLISTRKLSATDNPLMTLIFTGFTGCIVISLIVPFFWTSLSLSQWVLLISLAAIGTMAHFLIILSLSYAEASKLAPLGYSEIIMNVIIGYYFFGDFPDQWIWIGLIIIVASGIYISLRETKKTI